MKIKRFRVFDIENQKLIGKFDTISECVSELSIKWEDFKKKPGYGGDFFVDDIVEDTEVNWSELMQAWDDGERPEDLSMF